MAKRAATPVKPILASPAGAEMFVTYHVRLEFEEKLAAGLPKDPSRLLTFLTVRSPAIKPENAMPLDELADEIDVYEGYEGDEACITTTFCQKDGVPVWEARVLKSHVKDCASCLAKLCAMSGPPV